MRYRRGSDIAGFAMGCGLWMMVGLVGCSASADRPTIVEFWGMGREGEVVSALLPEFERLHPDIRVEVQQIPWTAAHQKLLTAFAGDATPDVAQLGNTWIPEFAAVKALVPLDASVLRSKVVEPNDYFSGIWDTNVVGGRLYGVPWYVDTRILYYRRDLLADVGFDAPPKTWAEWLEMMEAIRKMGTDRYGVVFPLNEYAQLLTLGMQQDAPLVRTDEARANFSSKGFRKVLDFYFEIFRRDLAPVVTNTQISNVWNEFGRGYFTFYIEGPWYVGELRRRLPARLQGTWSTAPLPGPGGPGYSTAGGSSLVVFESSRHHEASWQLVEYLSRPDIQERFHSLTGNLPPRRSVWEREGLTDDEYAHAFREQLERVRPSPKIPECERIVIEMQRVAEAGVRGGWTAERAAAEMDRRADEILEKRRWMIARGRAE